MDGDPLNECRVGLYLLLLAIFLALCAAHHLAEEIAKLSICKVLRSTVRFLEMQVKGVKKIKTKVNESVPGCWQFFLL